MPWADPSECAGLDAPDRSYSHSAEPDDPWARGMVIAAVCLLAGFAALVGFCWAMSSADAALKANTRVEPGCGLPMREVTVDAELERHLVDADERGRAPVMLTRNKGLVVTEDGLFALSYREESDDLRLVDSDEWALVRLSVGGNYLIAEDMAGWWPFDTLVERKVKGVSPNRQPHVHWELRVPFDKLGKEKGSAGRLADGDKGARLVS